MGSRPHVNDNIVPLAPVRDTHRRARALYWQGWELAQIAEELGVPYDTVKSWKARRKWDDNTPLQRCEDRVEARFCMLVDKDKKTGADFKEIDLLGRQMTALARIRRFQAEGGHEGDLNERVGNRNAGPKKQKRKNYIPPELAERICAAVGEGLIGYQEGWLDSSSLRTRFLLKSRQIGATWYFAREALKRALETGNNQIFISASRAQANVFRNYICDFVREVTREGEASGLQLTGDPIIIDRGEDENGESLPPVRLMFLGTNYRTAQSYNGDVYIDEAFWIHGFEQIFAVASGMASHRQFRRTIFSTPSSITHEAYRMWSGERFNHRRAKDQKAKFDISHKALKGGALGPDRIWRQIVNIHDAIESGAEFFDLEEIQIENSVDEFAYKYLCEFIDDTRSMFPMAIMQPCMVDSWEVWRKDFDPYQLRPFGNGEVWLGYDPQESDAGDNAALVVVAPPKAKGGKFRVLEKLQWRGKDFEAQAGEIRRMTHKYNVTHIAIDKSGVGNAVYQLVRNFFHAVRGIDYSPVVKGQMVLKAKNVISNRRLEFDAGWVDLAQAFMSIRVELNPSQTDVRYVASRSGDTGHADLAWAVMHVLFNEPLDTGDARNRRTSVMIS